MYKTLSFLCVSFFLFVSCQSSFERVSPESTGISSQAVLNFVNAVEKDVDALHGIIIMRHGKIISKGWWAPYKEENTHVLYSLSKSFTSTAIGIASDQGILSLDDKVVSFFPDDLPENPSENLQAMTIKDLLIMGTGNHNDTLGPIKETAEKNWPKVFFAQPVEHKPGSYFKYNTGATYMLSAILQKKTGKTLVEFLKTNLFDPLGIDDYTWETDPMGVNTGGYGLKVKTETIAKLGQMYLQKGMWNGKRILSQKWIEMASSKQINNGSNPKSDWNQGYGFQFWMCRHNAFRGDGAFGQYCLVMPEQDMVIAIHGGLGNMQKVLDLVWEHILPAVKPEAIDENPESNAKLTVKMNSLELPGVTGNSAPAPGIIGKTYKFEENDKSFKSVSFGNEGEQTFVQLENAHGTQMIFYTKKQWIDDEITLEKKLVEAVATTNGMQKIACKGAWLNPSHLKVIMYMNETPFRLTFDFKFDGGKLELDLNYNVFFGKRDYKFKAVAK